MGLFSGFESDTPNRGGVYLLPGSYLFKVGRIMTKKTRPPKNEEILIVELEVVTSTNPELPPGSQPGWILKISQDAFRSNFKGFLMAVFGEEDPSQITEEVAEMVLGPKQAAMGKTVSCTCVNIKTRAGTDFTKPNWSPAGE